MGLARLAFGGPSRRFTAADVRQGIPMDRVRADTGTTPSESLEHFDTGGRAFPIFSIALVQSETEMLHAPAHDLGPMLADCRNVSHTLFTERTFTTLFDPNAAYD